MTVPTYWWRARRNFGDRLTPWLLQHFARLDPTWAPVPEAQIACVGSILEHIPNDWGGYVVGCGKMFENSTPSLRFAKVLAVRGPLSARGLRGDFAMGDPGLLADELVHVETRTHDLGLVPHWSDTKLATDPRFAKFDPIVIDPRGGTLETIQAIGSCRKIISSSLHGLIIADSFGIPRRFEYTPRFDKEGGMFKFHDYSASVATPIEVGKTLRACRYAVEDRKSEIYDAFRVLSGECHA